MHPDERFGMEGSAISRFATCTSVDMSKDLSVAKVRVSIMSDEEGRIRAWSRLNRMSKHIRFMVAQSMGYLRRYVRERERER